MDKRKTAQALKTIFDQCGTGVLQDRRRFEAYLEDLLPGSSCSTERLVLRHALDSSALTLLLRAPAFTEDTARRAVEQLRQESRMGAEDAEFVVRCVIAARGGNPSVLNAAVPKPPKPAPPAPEPEPYVPPEPAKPTPPATNQKPKSKCNLIAAVTAAALVLVLLGVGIGSMANWDTGDDPTYPVVNNRDEQESTATPPSEQAPTASLLKLERTIGPTIAAGGFHTVGLRSDGTVVAVGSNAFGACDVNGWTDIVAIAVDNIHTVGLKSDGTVVVASDYNQYNVSSWTDMVEISVANGHMEGLKSDGTVVAVGMNDNGQCNVDGWTDIVAIAAGSDHTVGLKSDGTVVAVGMNDNGQCNVSSWTDIAAIAASYYRTVGLKSDGTVVVAGDHNLFNVSSWTDIVAIACWDRHIVGLKSDGTVVVVGSDVSQFNVNGWTDIVAIATGPGHTVGLKSDGTVVAVGDNFYGQCNVDGWTEIMLPDGSNQGGRTTGVTFIPGIYEATAAGYGSSVKVNMTFDETQITDIRVDVSEETPGIGGSIGDQMASAILSAQSAGVDAVSGATITSNAVKTAAADCISRASGGWRDIALP